MQSENTMYKEAYITLPTPHYLLFVIVEYISFIGQLFWSFYLCKFSFSSLMSKKKNQLHYYVGI